MDIREMLAKKLIKKVNNLSIEMTHARRHKDAKKKRKAIFRELKALLKRITGHGLRYHDVKHPNFIQEYIF